MGEGNGTTLLARAAALTEALSESVDEIAFEVGCGELPPAVVVRLVAELKPLVKAARGLARAVDAERVPPPENPRPHASTWGRRRRGAKG
jgi:hypothetical protein